MMIVCDLVDDDLANSHAQAMQMVVGRMWWVQKGPGFWLVRFG